MSVPNNIILYTYPFSPYGQRIQSYLSLRGLEYAICEQPVQLPRPDLEFINVGYRRIPVLAVGRDLYCDTHIILDKLEQLFPKDTLGGKTEDERAIEKLLDRYVTDAGIFPVAAGLIPPEAPVLNDDKFVKDREDLFGITMSPENQRKGRANAVAAITDFFNFLETTLLADNRKWILKGDKPSLADLQASWPLTWLDSMPGAVPQNVLDKHPKTVAWVDRFRSAVRDSGAPKPSNITGDEAVKNIIKSSYAENPATVAADDPTGIKAGTEVEVVPTDYGRSGKTQGRLVSLTPFETAIAVKTKGGDEFLTHFPRWGFNTTPVSSGKL